MPLPAERPSWPPRPGIISTLCTVVPVGSADSGSVLPRATGASFALGVASAPLPPAAPGVADLGREQRLLRLLLRELIEGEAGGVAAPGRGGTELADRHARPPTRLRRIRCSGRRRSSPRHACRR